MPKKPFDNMHYIIYFELDKTYDFLVHQMSQKLYRAYTNRLKKGKKDIS